MGRDPLVTRMTEAEVSRMVATLLAPLVGELAKLRIRLEAIEALIRNEAAVLRKIAGKLDEIRKKS